MLTDRSFVLTVPPEPDVLGAVRHALGDRLPPSTGRDEDVLLLAALLVRHAQCWRGADGPIRLRTATSGRVVHLEVDRDLVPDADDGPGSPEAMHGLVDVLTERAERFTVSAFAGRLSLSAQKVVRPFRPEPVLDLRDAA